MNKRQKEISGLLLILFSIISFVSLLGHNFTENPYGLSADSNVNNFLGIFGVYISHYYYSFLGYTSIIFPVFFLFLGYLLLSNFKSKIKFNHTLYILFIGLYLSVIMSFIAYTINSQILSNNFSGFFGISIFNAMNSIVGILGVSVLLLFIFILFITNIFKISIYELFLLVSKNIKQFLFILYTLFHKIYGSFIKLIKKKKVEDLDTEKDSLIDENEIDFEQEKINIKDNDEIDKNELNIKDSDNEENDSDYKSSNSADEIEELNSSSSDNLDEMIVEEELVIEEGNLDENKKNISNYFKYKLPNLEYLNDPIEIARQNDDELRAKGEQLKYALSTFGVDGEVKKTSPGPIISLFEVEPAIGVRVNKFVNLSDDLARIMKAQRVRIIAPIPGSKSVGIELPNDNISTVYMKSILNSKKFIESKSKLSIALGKTTTGDAYVFDLCKMPHLLVAGATGAGKSVCINTIILSILYKSKPDEVKFILIDPKKLELSTYKSLVGYHLITSSNLDEYVMTTAENSVAILNSAIIEMERRFQVFSDARVRNIDEYHKKQKIDDSLEKIPYIVVLIDELADLMMTSGRSVEEPITRLAQKARAVGIHLVVATQRPSVDVITGLIKSNFPSRISFQVSSKIDSRTIIDQMGAEKLLGRGDMLFLLPGSASPLRLHNAFVTLEEIEKVMEHISKQPKPDEIKLPEYEIKKSNSDVEIIDDEHDEYLKDAAKLVFEYQQASVSLLQRKFRIGYSRAGRIVDELESLGIISSYNGSKAREVLVDQAYINEIFGED